VRRRASKDIVEIKSIVIVTTLIADDAREQSSEPAIKEEGLTRFSINISVNASRDDCCAN
jgi:hypothetical protein